MRQGRYLYILLVLIVLSAGALFVYLYGGRERIRQWSSVDRQAVIHPDYSGIVCPPNIAPLNFMIEEKGSCYFVKIYSREGEPIEVFSRSPKIIIPVNSWHRLLDANRGEELYFDIFVKAENGQWNRFSVISNKIAKETIDGYLVYRKIHPSHNLYRRMVTYQRNLSNYDEISALDNENYNGGCAHCHSFCNNRTDKMLTEIRSQAYGNSLVMVENGKVSKLKITLGFACWHPSGRVIMTSINDPHLLIHTARSEIRDIVDLDSLLVYYVVDSKTIKTSPNISRKDRLETFPTWSPDGRYLYFCSAPMPWPWSERHKFPPERYDQVKYDLVRISYDLETDKWGELETIVSAKDTGLSAGQPGISPDGRWLMFCMCEYSCWPTYHPSSDIYIMDLKAARETGRYEYRRLEVNSDQCESWHSWSSNSRWIAFSSKKSNHLFTRSYLAYIDENGRSYKALVLPQKDPTLYDSCLESYTMPELVIESLHFKGEGLARAVRNPGKVPLVDMAITQATPKAGSGGDAAGYQELQQRRE